MRYRIEIDIDAPREKVLELFLDPKNLHEWQTELVSFEQLGDKKERGVGSQSRQVHRMGKQEMR